MRVAPAGTVRTSGMSRYRVALLLTSAFGAVLAVVPRAAAPPLDERTAIHVLNRTTFGVRAVDIAHLQQAGLEKYVDEQLHPERIQDATIDARLSGFETVSLGLRALAER